MKLIIPKQQTGGRILFSAVANPSAFWSGEPGGDISSGSSSKKSSSSNDDGLLSKETMNKLNEGLPNEVAAFNQALAAIETKIDAGMPINRYQLADLRSMANRVIQQSKYLADAEKYVEKNESRDDVAVDQDGYIYAINQEGEVKKVSFNDFDFETQKALSIGELIEYRRNAPEAINDSDIIKTIGNSIGVEKINDFIQDLLKGIGTSSNKEEAYRTLKAMIGTDPKQMSQQVYDKLQALAEASNQIGLDAIFKLKQSTSNNNIKEAANYLISILPKNMRMQLQGTYIAQGLPTNKNYAVDLIQLASSAHSTTSYEFGIDYQDSLTKKAQGITSGSGGSGKTFYQNANEILFDMDINQTEIELKDPAYNNQTGIKVKGTQIPSLTTDKNQSISNTPLGLALGESIGKYLDYNNIFMGEQKISEGMLNNIAYTNDHVAVVWMPVTGNHEIDWAGFHACSAAEEEITQKNITAIADKQKVHAKHHSFATYDENGNLVPVTQTERFAMTYGYTIDDLIDENNNSMILELTGKEEDQVDSLINSIYNKKIKNTFGIAGIDHKNKWDDIFKVPVFIRVEQNASFDSYVYGGHGDLMTPTSTQQTMIQQQINTPVQSQEQFVYGSTNSLYQN